MDNEIETMDNICAVCYVQKKKYITQTKKGCDCEYKICWPCFKSWKEINFNKFKCLYNCKGSIYSNNLAQNVNNDQHHNVRLLQNRHRNRNHRRHHRRNNNGNHDREINNNNREMKNHEIFFKYITDEIEYIWSTEPVTKIWDLIILKANIQDNVMIWILVKLLVELSFISMVFFFIPKAIIVLNVRNKISIMSIGICMFMVIYGVSTGMPISIWILIQSELFILLAIFIYALVELELTHK